MPEIMYIPIDQTRSLCFVSIFKVRVVSSESNPHQSSYLNIGFRFAVLTHAGLTDYDVDFDRRKCPRRKGLYP
jgi:hypothetical protein